MTPTVVYRGVGFCKLSRDTAFKCCFLRPHVFIGTILSFPYSFYLKERIMMVLGAYILAGALRCSKTAQYFDEESQRSTRSSTRAQRRGAKLCITRGARHFVEGHTNSST